MTTDPVRGKTLRWSYEDGPTAGTTFEHDFGEDGRVQYRMVDGADTSGGYSKRSGWPIGSASTSSESASTTGRSSSSHHLPSCLRQRPRARSGSVSRAR